MLTFPHARELPEVETTKRGITPHIKQQQINEVVVRQHQLRWPIPPKLPQLLREQIILNVERRAKYLLIKLNNGTLIIHLGMSGNLRILASKTKPQKHDHFDLILKNQKIMRFTDPRRFGAILWAEKITQHPLLKKLGPEPLSKQFNAHYLLKKAQNRKLSIKQFIMNNEIVVGVGNIYAQESLFIAKIHPQTSAENLHLAQYQKLVVAIKKILRSAIKQGGTTLKDFLKSDGKPGYFWHQLQVYGRAQQNCYKCNNILQEIRQSQRSTVFCANCQKNDCKTQKALLA